MADSGKVTDLPELVTLSGVDLFYVIDDPDGTPASKKISLDQFLRDLPSNTTIKATLTVQQNTTIHGSNSFFTSNVNIEAILKPSQLDVANNRIRITKDFFTPASNSETISKGTMWWDENFIYVATADNTIKRVALSDFS